MKRYANKGALNKYATDPVEFGQILHVNLPRPLLIHSALGEP